MKADTDSAANTGSATINYLDIKGFNKDDKIIIKDTTVVDSSDEKLIATGEYKIMQNDGSTAGTKGDKSGALTAGAGSPAQSVVSAEGDTAANTG